MQPHNRPDGTGARVAHNRPSADPIAACFDVARIAGPRLERLDRELDVIGRLFRSVPCHNPPVHGPAAGGELRVHVQHPAEITYTAEPERAQCDVGLNRRSVVVASSDLANVSIHAGQ